MKSYEGVVVWREWKVLEYDTAYICVWDPQTQNISLSLETSALLLYWRRAEKKGYKELLEILRKKMTKIWPWHMLLRKTGTCLLSHQNWQLDGSPNRKGNHYQAINLPRCVLIYTCINEAKTWDKCQCTLEYEFKGSRFFLKNDTHAARKNKQKNPLK